MFELRPARWTDGCGGWERHALGHIRINKNNNSREKTYQNNLKPKRIKKTKKSLLSTDPIQQNATSLCDSPSNEWMTNEIISTCQFTLTARTGDGGKIFNERSRFKLWFRGRSRNVSLLTFGGQTDWTRKQSWRTTPPVSRKCKHIVKVMYAFWLFGRVLGARRRLRSRQSTFCASSFWILEATNCKNKGFAQVFH